MKRETTLAFLAGVTVTGAFFAGMGMGSANGSAAEPLRYVGIAVANTKHLKILREDGQVFQVLDSKTTKYGEPGPTK